ncbi:DUF6622 family protein [Chitinasiproducens palmae]|uniref:DUF1453 domain-containing protein n=1 Tax=Chitinasiproducens palmae TaxID=1770053 RepID=A0A1H2PNW4_9BURK|nr:DUF6622 family protein [Chitinasiproducens palmae]SDV48298.1 hypothetical protein SAMN05216551_104337 [Chitinasiproducens palmae]
MSTVLDALLNTPWWVYALLAYLVVVGRKAMRDNVTPVGRLFIMPIVLALLSLSSLLTGFTQAGAGAFAWLIGIAAGSVGGWLLMPRDQFQVDTRAHTVWRRGSVVPLCLFLAIFVVKYAFGYMLGTDPSLAHDLGFVCIELIVSGAVTGLFVGRVARVVAAYRRAEYVPAGAAESLPGDRAPTRDERR